MLGEDLAKSAALLTSFTWLAYWTGRWYKEWYFAQFGIQYEVLGFDVNYYLFGSWATVATAAGSLMLVATPTAFLWWRLSWPYIAVSLIVTASAAALQVWHPAFHSDGALWRKILGSPDIVVMFFGVISLVILIAAFFVHDGLPRQIPGVMRVPWAIRWVAIFLFTWAYLAGMGYIVGEFHGKAAIWNGKMGTRWVKHAGSWWVFAVRADSERNFIFDRVTRETKSVTDAQIEAWDGPVTNVPR